MKKLLLSMMLGGALLGNAETTTADFSYIDGVEDYFGMGPNYKTEVYDVAIFLPGNVFSGYTIKDIKMPVRNISGIENYGAPTVWLSTELKTTSNKNVPDIGTYDASISMVGDEAVLAGTLPESYTIGDKGVYVGVTVNVLKQDDSTAYPISLGASDTPSSFWLHIPSFQTYVRWTNGYDKFGYGCGISVTIDNVPPHDVRIVNIPSDIYTSIDTPVTVDMELSAVGSQEVNSVDFEYEIGGKPYTYHYDLPKALPAGIGNKINVPIEIPAQSEPTVEEVAFKVTKVNGEANTDQATAVASLYVLKTMPVRQTLMEEYTGTWCGYCTRGYAALEYIKENHPDFVVAAFHGTNGTGVDPMIITSKLPQQPQKGYPGEWRNRAVGADPYFGVSAQSNGFEIVNDILALNAQFTPWSVSVSHTWTSDDVLTATANLTNVIGYESGKYKMVYLLVADGLTGTGRNWVQTNYYNSDLPHYIEQLNAFCRGGEYGKASVAGLVFNDVVISTTGIYGIDGSIPASLEKDSSVTHSIEFDLSKISETLLPDKNKLRVIAAVIDGSGKVLNCAKDEVNDYVGAGVESIGNPNAPIEFYNLNGVKVAEPSEGIFIRRQGGKAEKVIIK